MFLYGVTSGLRSSTTPSLPRSRHHTAAAEQFHDENKENVWAFLGLAVSTIAALRFALCFTSTVNNYVNEERNKTTSWSPTRSLVCITRLSVSPKFYGAPEMTEVSKTHFAHLYTTAKTNRILHVPAAVLVCSSVLEIKKMKNKNKRASVPRIDFREGSPSFLPLVLLV